MSRLVFTVFIAAATLLLGACSVFANTVVGTGHATTEQRTVDAFTKVRVDTAISATVIVGPDVTVAVTADDNLQSSVSTSVIAGRLTISLKTGAQPRTPISVAVTVPNLEEADVGSAANLIATGINTSSFSGQADSAGTLVVRGNADDVHVSASSAGSADLGDVPAQTASVSISSAGRATVNAQQSVDGSVDSGGVLHVEGQPPTVTVTTDSGGAVIRD